MSGGNEHLEAGHVVARPLGGGPLGVDPAWHLIQTPVLKLKDKLLTVDESYIDWTGLDLTPYSWVRFMLSARSNYAALYDEIRLRVNADAGPNHYSWQSEWAYGNLAGAPYLGHDSSRNHDTGSGGQQVSGSSIFVGYAAGANAHADQFAQTTGDIFRPADSNVRKNVRSTCDFDDDAGNVASANGPEILHFSGFWSGIAAITQIRFFPVLGTVFKARTRAVLWGYV